VRWPGRVSLSSLSIKSKKLVYTSRSGRIRQTVESPRVLLGPSLPALQASCMRSIAATIPGISLDFSSVTGDV
jgi:hypothetical protein